MHIISQTKNFRTLDQIKHISRLKRFINIVATSRNFDTV